VKFTNYLIAFLVGAALVTAVAYGEWPKYTLVDGRAYTLSNTDDLNFTIRYECGDSLSSFTVTERTKFVWNGRTISPFDVATRFMRSSSKYGPVHTVALVRDGKATEVRFKSKEDYCEGSCCK
jgi:hypothetical protein